VLDSLCGFKLVAGECDGTGKEWEIIDAFGRAYMAHFPLEEQELLSLPDIFRLRDATSLLYRIGRYREACRQ